MDYVISVRNRSGDRFGSDCGETVYLEVPPDAPEPLPAHTNASKADWFDHVKAAATWAQDDRVGGPRGDILFFVHGFNNNSEGMLVRHRGIRNRLRNHGFKGDVVSFDWPSENSVALYLEDRHDAKKTALQLVDDGIKQFARLQCTDCTINLHVLAHSMGAFVVREAFDDADDARLATNSWMVSQVILAAGDISRDSMPDGNPTSESLYRHCLRLTNYFNREDSVLKISNAKRVGLAPRVGRTGLPTSAPQKAIDVDCSDFFNQLKQATDDIYFQAQFDGADRTGVSFSHSFYLGSDVFIQDLFETIKGDLGYERIPTRIDTGVEGSTRLTWPPDRAPPGQ